MGNGKHDHHAGTYILCPIHWAAKGSDQRGTGCGAAAAAAHALCTANHALRSNEIFSATCSAAGTDICTSNDAAASSELPAITSDLYSISRPAAGCHLCCASGTAVRSPANCSTASGSEARDCWVADLRRSHG